MNRKYLIDTDTLVFLSRGKFCIQDKMNQVGLANCLLPEISLAELYLGIYKGRGQESFVSFLEENFKVLPISSSLRTFAKTRAYLEQNGIRLEDLDIFIAAIALDMD